VTGVFVSNEQCWDKIAQEYDQATAIFLDEVHYGPLVPGERTLNVLGDVRGKAVLDLGRAALLDKTPYTMLVEARLVDQASI
jgi:hypothetical protein